ncbi:MAG: tetratricopeptide repeat protein [Deltaproteobacteria bacterium]|nr:tetratricopeptide repeat protein [Deltaproteobacteria bacterium]
MALIVLVAVAIYSNIYSVPFVLDDTYQIEENPDIRDFDLFLSPKVLFYPRPLGMFSFALNYRFGKMDLFGYHLVNVLIHIANGFLVYFLTIGICKGLSNRCLFPNFRYAQSQHSAIPLMALFTALIFIAHPIQTQAVTYLSQRFTSMAAMFYFLSILFYIKARFIVKDDDVTLKGRKIIGPSAYFFGAVLCGVLAFLSKQNTASLPGAVLLVEYLLFDRTWQGWKKKLLWFGPIFFLMGLFILYVSGIFRQGVQFGTLLEDVSGILRAPATDVGRWVYFCTQLNVIVIYIRLLFLPVGQNLDYMYPFKAGFFDGYTPLALFFLMAIGALGVWNIRKRPVISFGIFWFFITLSIESSFFPIKDALFEHRLYLPMFGFAIVVTYMVFWLLSVHRYWLFAVSMLIVISLGTATYMRNRVWQSSVSLWSDSVSKAPKNYRAHINLGYALKQKGRFKDAIFHYQKALRMEPRFVPVHNNLGVAMAQQGNLEKAFYHFTEALRLRPGDSEALTNYGQALMQKGDIKGAVIYFKKALRSSPRNAKAHNNFGIALAHQGNLKKAIVHFSRAAEIEPHNAKIQRNLGQAFMLEGQLPKAVRHYAAAVRINPGDAQTHSTLGIVLMRQGNTDGAIAHFTKALKLNPNLNEARQGMRQARRIKEQLSPNK